MIISAGDWLKRIVSPGKPNVFIHFTQYRACASFQLELLLILSLHSKSLVFYLFFPDC